MVDGGRKVNDSHDPQPQHFDPNGVGGKTNPMMGTFIVKADAIQSLPEKRKVSHIVAPFDESP